MNNERTEELIEALQWLREMAGYAVNHLDPAWASKGGSGSSNRSDLQSAISQADAVLEQAALDAAPAVLPEEMGRRAGTWG